MSPTSAAVPRSYATAAFDRLFGWFVGLPAETTSYSVTPVRIPMKDGISLAADLYLPSNRVSKPDAILLAQGPYGRGIGNSIMDADVWAARGYGALLVSCRGTWGSGGQFDPGRNEAADAQDIVLWMREQDWYPGGFATLGASYLGYSQWALLHDPPEDLVACSIAVGWHDYSYNMWGTGAFRLDRLGWADMVAWQEEGPWWGQIRRMATRPKRLLPVQMHLPLGDGVAKHFEGKADWLLRAIGKPDVNDTYYAPMQHSEALDKVNVPVRLNSGWYDLYIASTMEQFARLQARGLDVELTVGPWSHIGATGVRNAKEVFDWMEEKVSKRKERAKHEPVKIYVTGANEWRFLPRWPPTATLPVEYFLHLDNSLSRTEPGGLDYPSAFTYDPEDPTPTVGGPLLFGGGRVNDDSLAARKDVLTFTSEPLEEDLEVLGRPFVELAHDCDNPRFDIFLRLSEVLPDGKSYNITETFKRLDTDLLVGRIRLEMTDCGHLFKKGVRLRLYVGGGCFPMFDRNLGTDESLATSTTIKTTTHRIGHGLPDFSSMTLPVATKSEPDLI
jgi:uncharacterized protein